MGKGSGSVTAFARADGFVRVPGTVEYVESGEEVEVTHRWAGIFGLTQDMLPLVGSVPGRDGRVWVAGGYSGHGNVPGFACGELVADALLGDLSSPQLALFDPARFFA